MKIETHTLNGEDVRTRKAGSLPNIQHPNDSIPASFHRPQYWRSLEELAQNKEFQERVQREFPAGAAEWEDGVSRRNFLKLTSASLALAGLTACTKQPIETIVPYVRQPEELRQRLNRPVYL